MYVQRVLLALATEQPVTVEWFPLVVLFVQCFVHYVQWNAFVLISTKHISQVTYLGLNRGQAYLEPSLNPRSSLDHQ